MHCQQDSLAVIRKVDNTVRVIDRGDDVIVGVNKYRLEEEEQVDILEIDNDAVRESQLARLAAVPPGSII